MRRGVRGQKRQGWLLLCALFSGCGAGPKHLPKSQFNDAEQAFDLLQKAERSADTEAGDELAAMAAKHALLLPKGSEVRNDLLKYQSVVVNTPLHRSLAALDEASPGHGSKNHQEELDAERAQVVQDTVMLEVCRANAERWIHAGITYHPECTQKLYGIE